tara:strand:+ start:131 stop:319 length:189 start_codon:yes stop_codon:yes gene_type:complete
VEIAVADLRQAFDESYYRLMGGGVSIADKGDSFFNRFYQKFTDASPEVKGNLQILTSRSRSI